MKLVSRDSAILLKPAEELAYDDENLESYANMLLDYYHEKDGHILGISLPQLGVSKRMCLCKLPKMGAVIMVNPKMKWSSGWKMSQEGCETLGGKKNQYHVRRPLMMKLEYSDLEGRIYNVMLNFNCARIVCHELDHLDGILLSSKGVKVK